MVNNIKEELLSTEERISNLNEFDNSFEGQVIKVLELANKSYEIFKSSETEKKRRILQILFPNLQMDGKKLVFTMRKPFNLFLKEANHTIWLPIARTLRTKRREDVMGFAMYASEMRLVT